MTTVHVKDLVGEDCVAAEDGQRIHDVVLPKLQAGDEVELDFSGCTVFASPFLNPAIGQLLKDLPPESLNKLLKIADMSPEGHKVVRRVIDNAKRYYRDPRVQQAVGSALATRAVET